MVKIIGIPSEQEALALYDEWKKERDDRNKCAARHDTIIFLTVTIVCVLVMAGIVWSSGWNFTFDALGPIRFLGLCVAPIIGAFIVFFSWEGQWEYSEYSWPLKYKYYIITKDMTILDSKIKRDVIDFVLENSRHEVSAATLVGLNKKYRTDIDEIVVDLNDEAILIPYHKK